MCSQLSTGLPHLSSWMPISHPGAARCQNEISCSGGSSPTLSRHCDTPTAALGFPVVCRIKHPAVTVWQQQSNLSICSEHPAAFYITAQHQVCEFLLQGTSPEEDEKEKIYIAESVMEGCYSIGQSCGLKLNIFSHQMIPQKSDFTHSGALHNMYVHPTSKS